MSNVFALIFALLAAPLAHAQASAIPSAQAPAVDAVQHGRELLAAMVTALGGDAWQHRRTWQSTGNFGHFYHGIPGDSQLKFDEYHSTDPDATRIVVVTRAASPLAELLGVPIGKDHADVVEVFIPGHGYEITYKGKKDLPPDIVADAERERAHTIEKVVDTWLPASGTTVLYEGPVMVDRRPADQISVLNAQNDAVTLRLDATTHLPVEREYRYRDPQFHDFDTDREVYGNYQLRDGVMTPFDVSRYKNGDLVAQRFLQNVRYNVPLSPALFDPDAPLTGKQPRQ